MNLTFKQYVQLILTAVGAMSVAYYALSPYHDCMRWNKRYALSSFVYFGGDEMGESYPSFLSRQCISGQLR